MAEQIQPQLRLLDTSHLSGELHYNELRRDASTLTSEQQTFTKLRHGDTRSRGIP